MAEKKEKQAAPKKEAPIPPKKKVVSFQSEKWKTITFFEDDSIREMTEAMEIPKGGCFIRSIIKDGDKLSTSIQYAPRLLVVEKKSEEGKVISRELAPF